MLACNYVEHATILNDIRAKTCVEIKSISCTNCLMLKLGRKEPQVIELEKARQRTEFSGCHPTPRKLRIVGC